MPGETGPTLYLPHSQKYGPGYIAYHQPEFVSYFEADCIQLPLAKGDAGFFNPALFHGAGTNRSSDARRIANLLQVPSGLRPGHGVRGSHRDVPRSIPRSCSTSVVRRATSSPLAPGGTRSPPILTRTADRQVGGTAKPPTGPWRSSANGWRHCG